MTSLPSTTTKRSNDTSNEHNVFEIAASLGHVRLQNMPVVDLGPRHAALVCQEIGRAHTLVTLGESAVVIACLHSRTEWELLETSGEERYFDMLEWRVDTDEIFKDATTTAQREHAMLAGLSDLQTKVDVPVLVTIRTTEEGGQAQLNVAEYEHLIRAIAPYADAVDIQAFTPLNAAHVKNLIHDVRKAGAVVFASTHNFDDTPPEDEILGHIYDMKHLGAQVAKVAYSVSGPAQALAVMNAQMRARTLVHIPVIAIGMGGAGALTRIGGSAIGSAASYATLTTPQAPGQLHVNAVREALDIIEGHE